MGQLIVTKCTVLALLSCAVQTLSVATAAQETKAAQASQGAAEPAKSGVADGASSPDPMGNRRPRYRLQKSDVLTIKFSFAPEFDQTVSVQPDGFITLKGLEEMHAEDLTVDELRRTVAQVYAATLHDPEVLRVRSLLCKSSRRC
jgi:protein involved in polysaccharide export with SLBB domain